MVLRVGDEVVLSKRNEERTRFCEFSLRSFGEILICNRLAGSFDVIMDL
jgi:hypothetical protein